MLIGLTGGIACGKTTVAGMLKAKGALVIDADQVARDVVCPGSQGLNSVVDSFGPWVLNEDDTLNRSALSKHIFAHPEARQSLEAILHPLIAQESQRQIAGALATGAPLVVYDAALLFESGRAEHFRPIIVVYAAPKNQRERLMARDGLSEEQANQRIQSQMPVMDKVAQADFAISNDDALQKTQEQVDAVWSQLCP